MPAVSKTNVTGREKARKHIHLCPTCSQPATFIVFAPGHKIRGVCSNGHVHLKQHLRLSHHHQPTPK